MNLTYWIVAETDFEAARICRKYLRGDILNQPLITRDMVKVFHSLHEATLLREDISANVAVIHDNPIDLKGKTIVKILETPPGTSILPIITEYYKEAGFPEIATALEREAVI